MYRFFISRFYRILMTAVVVGSSVLGASFVFAAEGQGAAKSKTTFDRALSALDRNPKAPDAESELIHLFSLWNDVGSKPVLGVLSRYAEDKGASERVRARARFLSAVAAARLGIWDEAASIIRKMGFISDWTVIGPFSNVGGAGFDTVYPPEKEGADITLPMVGKDGPVQVRPLPQDAFHLGLVHLEALSTPSSNTCYYARTVISSEKNSEALLHMGAGGAFVAYWNGKRALIDAQYRASGPDRALASVPLETGNNVLLVKVCTEEVGDFGFYARLTDKMGNALLPSNVALPPDTAVDRAHSAKKPVKLPEPLETLVDAAMKKTTDPKAQEIAARYLYFTDAEDLNSTLARDMAERACELGEKPENCLLWSVSAQDRNEQRRALDRAKVLGPDSPEVLTASAEWSMDGPEPAQALPDIERTLSVAPDFLRAKMLKLEVMQRRGFGRWAFKEADKLAAAHPDIPAMVDFAQYMADVSGSMYRSVALKAMGAKFNADESSRQRVLAEDALARGDAKALDTYINRMIAAAPYADETYVHVAELWGGLGKSDLAEKALRRRLVSAPKNASAMSDLGMFLMRENRRDEAIAVLTEALALRPQDASLAEYLRHLGPNEPFESSYIIPEEVFLGMRGKDANTRESKYLVDQTVVEVYESGLSSTFRQTVFEVGNRSDAKDWRFREIQYLPDSQQLKILAAKVYRTDGSQDKIIGRGSVPVSEPWYRLYYDVVADVFEFPSLNPGDVVEISYRLDDVSSQNIFNDYFGDFVFIEEEVPKTFWRYAVIAPKSRTLRFNQPDYILTKNVSEEDGKKVYSFEAKNIPSLHAEADMPGMSEVAAYLHVSTYTSWKELGIWYQGLIRHQMVADNRISEKVQELIRGKTKTIDKIRAIYDWVVTATRYVGLEFGIHGYKPYPASLVVSRGFGDCKDKASLLVTMLQEAGVDAKFVLIRTNNLGRLSSEPASLSAFNHAIAYVPSLHLYLDGTAEKHGVFELPFGDQGATALILRDNDAELVTTPVEPASRNTVAIHSKLVLDVQGNAALTSSASIVGRDAAALRRALETEATRKERFAGTLAALFPGSHVEDLKIVSLSNLEEPVKYEVRAKIPAYAVWRNDRLEIPIDDGLSLTARYARLSARTYDLIVGPTLVMERTAEIVVPKDFAPVDIPSSTAFSTRFGKLSITIVQKDHTVQVSRRFELLVDRVTPDEYQEFVSFIRKVDETLSMRPAFRRVK
jgi:transglutaminase-like putative cysteine protease